MCPSLLLPSWLRRGSARPLARRGWPAVRDGTSGQRDVRQDERKAEGEAAGEMSVHVCMVVPTCLCVYLHLLCVRAGMRVHLCTCV